MPSIAPQRFTEAEYLALETVSETKHEFVNGEIIAMAGAKPAHNVLATRTVVALTRVTGSRDCIIVGSDQRVHVPATGLYTYPDATVACGERRYKDDTPPTLLTPTVIAEVTSDSTEDYDRGTKFLHYQSIESLREYLIISHRERRIDHHSHIEAGQWLVTVHTADDAEIPLPALGGSVRLSEIYAGVDLEEGEPHA